MKLMSLLAFTSLLVPIIHAMEYPHIQLINAVWANDKALVQKLIDQNIDLNVSDADGLTALMHAANHRSLEMVELLVQAGAKLNIKDASGCTALFTVANGFKDDKALLESLINAGADVDTQNIWGNTPLMRTAYGNHHMVQSLIDAGAQLDIQNDNGDTALIIASSCFLDDSKPIVQALIDAGASMNIQNKHYQTAYLSANQAGNFLIADLVATAAHVRDQLFSLIPLPLPSSTLRLQDPVAYQEAVARVRQAIYDLEQLDKQHMFINYRDSNGNTPLHLAVLSGNRPITLVVLSYMFKHKQGKSIMSKNNLGYTPLSVALLTSPSKMFPLLYHFTGAQQAKLN